MKFEEALPLMRVGRKFETHSRKPPLAMWFEGEDMVVSPAIYALPNVYDMINDDWHEVRIPWREELKDGSFAEALAGMLHGEKWRRKCWNKKVNCWLSAGTPKVMWSINEQDYTLLHDDLTKTDWERVP